MTGHALQIAFVGRFYWHNGSSHALLGYARAAAQLGYDFRVSTLGIFDDIVQRHVPVAAADWKPDVMVFVFEERFLRDEGFAIAERVVPRSRRLVIDPDGKYSDPVTIGSDTNHPTDDSRAIWAQEFERLSDIVLQPRLGEGAAGSHSFLYFGIDRHKSLAPAAPTSKDYDIVYVGNNWYRWHDLVSMIGTLERVREFVPTIAIFGNFWDGSALPGYEEHTFSDPDFLRAHAVQTHPPVPFDSVEATMSRGRFTPLFVRPVLHKLGLVTPRMFESFLADTVPVLPDYLSYTANLYGEHVSALSILGDSDAMAQAATNGYAGCSAVASEIRETLINKHNYERRLGELLDFVGD